MAAGPAHGEEAAALYLEYLTAHEVQDMRADAVYLSAAPILHGVSLQRVEVFVVAADEGQRKGQALQPVQCRVVPAVPEPYAAEVSFVLNSG